MAYILFILFIIFFSACATQEPLGTHESRAFSSISNQPIYLQHSSVPRFYWPIKGKIINSFGETTENIRNKGLTIKAVSEKHVRSSADGQVVFSNYLKGWGQTLIIKHSGNFYTVYANLSTNLVKEGATVKNGEVLGELALNKNKHGGILHFEIRKGHVPQNPFNYLK